MNLLIDIGNTRTKWALHNGQSLSKTGWILNSDVESLGFPKAWTVTAAWASCVSSDRYFDGVESAVRSAYGIGLNRTRVVTELAGISNQYRTLDRLGVDRWVAALGARAVCTKGAVIIIDAGTAVTIDLLSANNQFEGGVILAGAELMHDVLVGQTAGIQSARADVVSVLGRSTQECVNAGVHFGLVGAIERIVIEMQGILSHTDGNNYDDSPAILLCGGDAKNLMPLLSFKVKHVPNLIFEGLAVIAAQDK